MRTIIAGSRGLGYSDCLDAIAACDWRPSAVISGTARGIDEAGEIWAASVFVPVERFPANWKAHGKQAGYLRNVEMAKHAEALIAVWDGKSRGTKHMIDIAKSAGLKVFVWKPLHPRPPFSAAPHL